VQGEGERFQSDMALEMKARGWGDVPLAGAGAG
jgi:hypothetical protein